MRLETATSLLLAIAAGVDATPLDRRSNTSLTAASLLSIAPNSKTCSNTDQCRTNAQAYQHFNDAFKKYGITSAGQMAAAVAWPAFESQEFVYKRSAKPKAFPGKGTSSMQSFFYNLKYARSIPELADKVAAIVPADEKAPDVVNEPETKGDLLELVMADEYTFASSSWFITNICKDDVRTALNNGTTDGFEYFLAICVGVPKMLNETNSVSTRWEYWNRAQTVFGLSNN